MTSSLDDSSLDEKQATPLLFKNSVNYQSKSKEGWSKASTVSFIRSAYHPRSLFRRKPISVCLQERANRGEDGNGLSESLGLSDLLGYGIGCTVGAGIYSQIAIGVGVAGPAVTLSFLIGAIACIFTALSYCEFTARVPVTGSAYTFAYASFGELLGWMIGWDLTLEYCISASAIARSWGDYFTNFWVLWGFQPPIWLNRIELGSATLSPAAAVIVLLCMVVMLFGIRSSSTFNVVMTILNIFVLLFFICVGATRVQPYLWTDFNGYIPFGASSILIAAGKLFFSYLGFDMVSSLAEETKNPQRNVPLGIIGSLIVAASIYVAVSVVATGMVPFMNLADSNAPLATAMTESGLPWAAKVISFGSLLGLTTATFTCLLGQPRIFYTMARDGLLFPFFKWTYKKTEVPLVGTLITGAFTAILAFFMNLDSLANAISVGTLLAFNLVNSGVMVIRYSGPNNKYLFVPMLLIASYVITSFISAFSFDRNYHLAISVSFGALSLICFALLLVYHFFYKFQNIPTTFKCPLVPLVPCIGIAINNYMLAGLDGFAWIRLVVWLVIGLVIYFGYGIRKSKLRVH